MQMEYQSIYQKMNILKIVVASLSPTDYARTRI
jgi:hypothetical protein